MSAVPTPPELPVQQARAPRRTPWRRHRRIGWAVLAGAVAAGLPSPVIASSGGGRRITDTANTRTVYLVVLALILLAIGLALFTWWFWRATRRDHESLAPLEVMADRRFLAADPIARQVMLDQSRPIGAAPLAPGAIEPLLLPAAPDAADAGEEVPVPTVVATEVEAAGEPGDLSEAAVAAEPEAVTTRTAAPAESGSEGDATTAIDLPVSADVGATEDESEDEAEAAPESSDLAESPAADVQLAEVEVAVEVEVETPVALAEDEHEASVAVAAVAGPGTRTDEATMAIDAVPAAPARVAAAMPAIRPAVATPTSAVPAVPADEAPIPVANGTTPARHPIDPGLPQPPAEPEPARHLTLAELVALDADRPLRFDENELTSTPSTGIPVIESAEAWVERQLAERRTTNGRGGPSHPADADADADADAADR